MPEIAEKAQDLFEIKGVLTKFMRMLFPLEFRIDSLANCGPMLPFHYPLLPGEMIFLPERLEPFGTRGDAYTYYFVTTAHLAARHDFGTFKLKLADIAGFEERGETGVEAIDSFVASFGDPGLAGALMRLAESARIDGELARRYRGLAPRIAGLNRALLQRLHPESLSTMLVRAALDLEPTGEELDSPLVRMASRHFAPVRARGADVMISVRQVSVLYNWLQDLIREARERGEGDPLSEEEAERMRNDLIKGMKGSETQTAGEGEDGEQGDGGGEPDQNIQMDVSGKQ